ncbi:unnamed protein product [Caenorhabditis auriculariae]|uniref:Uncharacterized protein n=1 Tax=Caenorhabditis auriculariae TaxID=2777116 RepID=A0A8S1HX12_9PELO|nr:unnamed protein product [Caenorhabditis auriculariae]
MREVRSFLNFVTSDDASNNYQGVLIIICFFVFTFTLVILMPLYLFFFFRRLDRQEKQIQDSLVKNLTTSTTMTQFGFILIFLGLLMVWTLGDRELKTRNTLKFCVWATWTLCFIYFLFICKSCDYMEQAPTISCADPNHSLIVYAIAVIDKLSAVLSVVLYYLIYRKILSLSSMVSSNHYRPEKRVMAQAVPFIVAKIMFVLCILPPWLLNSKFREISLVNAFYILDYLLIPTAPVNFFTGLSASVTYFRFLLVSCSSVLFLTILILMPPYLFFYFRNLDRKEKQIYDFLIHNLTFLTTVTQFGFILIIIFLVLGLTVKRDSDQEWEMIFDVVFLLAIYFYHFLTIPFIPLNINILLTILTLQRYFVVCLNPAYQKYVKGDFLNCYVRATWVLCFIHFGFLSWSCNYLPLTPIVDCELPRNTAIVYVVAITNKLFSLTSVILYYFIYRKILNLSNMVSKNQYRPERRVMQQALPFTVAKIVLLVLILPPWLLIPEVGLIPLVYAFYALDYCLIPTVIPLSFLSSFYRQYKSNHPNVVHQERTNAIRS